MKVLAIDPGYDRLGVAVLEKQNNREVVLMSDCVVTNKTDDLNDRVFMVGNAVQGLIETHNPDILAIEKLFFNNNQKTAMGVAEVRGVVLFLGKQHGCEIMEFGPQAIKVAVTGHGGSDKRAVIYMVKRLVSGVPEKALDDEYDAIAVGVTALAHVRL